MTDCVHPEVLPGHPQRDPLAVENCPTCFVRRLRAEILDVIEDNVFLDWEYGGAYVGGKSDAAQAIIKFLQSRKMVPDPRAEVLLKQRLARDLETTVERLDPKDVMRYDREAYDVLYVHGG